MFQSFTKPERQHFHCSINIHKEKNNVIQFSWKIWYTNLCKAAFKAFRSKLNEQLNLHHKGLLTSDVWKLLL